MGYSVADAVYLTTDEGCKSAPNKVMLIYMG